MVSSLQISSRRYRRHPLVARISVNDVAGGAAGHAQPPATDFETEIDFDPQNANGLFNLLLRITRALDLPSILP